MGILDSASAFVRDLVGIQPSAGFVEIAQGPAGSFAGGGGAKWDYGLSHSGSSPLINHLTMRQNARSAVLDNVHAKGIVTRMSDTIVDVGLRLEPDPNIEVLGLTPEQAQEFSESVGNRFHLWAKSKKITRNEQLNFYQLQRLVTTTQQRDNEYFIRFFYTDRRDLTNPLQLQMIDANQLDGYGFTDTSGFQYGNADGFVDGIKKDAAGRPISYGVYVKQFDGSYVLQEIPAVGRRSGRRLMIQGFVPQYPGQTRGFSNLGHALQEFENLTDFTSAQIKKAIMQSSINMFVEPGPTAPATNPFEDIVNYGAAGSVRDVTGNIVEAATEDGSFIDYVPIPEATLATPGEVGVFNLKKGEKLKPFESTAPSERFESFVNTFVSHLSASVSMPVEVLLMKFSDNYSASRATLLLFWRVAEIWRQELSADFLGPVYEAWLSGEIAKGRVNAPGWSDPLLREAWLCANWYGAPMPNIDPLKNAQADRLDAEIGATDLDRIARERNGSSGKLNRAKLAKQFAEITPAPWNTSVSVSSVDSEDETSEED